MADKPDNTASTASTANNPAANQDEREYFPVVALGASAGGLAALEQFLTALPPDSGMAFVVIQHLDPRHKSLLSELLKRHTRMPVLEVEDGMMLRPDTVFVIPTNCYLALHHSKLHLLEPPHASGPHAPIDYFFRSLAADQREKAVCIVLSGAGSEGALGLRAIKAEGGMAMVQEPGTAKYDGMPKSALATGLADYILTPAKMPEHLINYVKQTTSQGYGRISPSLPTQANLLEKVFLLIRSQTGHDFTYYKQNTIVRRIERRLAVNKIAGLADYVRFLQENPREVETLFKELLIGVTSFFRDREAFEAMETEVLPALLANRLSHQPLRIWVPGCATGEEAYSLAILCRRHMQHLENEPEIQIFATDIDPAAIESARMGLYSQSIADDVPAPWLEKYFNRENSSYRVNKKIRDMVTFALQNVLSDPPFSRMELISCRNLLIYLGTEIQKKVLSLFHYSLKPGGYLFLGSSETPGELVDYYTPLQRKWKIYRSKENIPGESFPLQIPVAATTFYQSEARVSPAILLPPQQTLYRNVAERIILNDYAPTGVLVDEDYNILFIRGRAGKYLEPADGAFTGNILAMAREGLKVQLATALQKAGASKLLERCENLAVKTNGGEQLLNLVVKPLADPVSLQGLLMVIFEDVALQNEQPGQAYRPGPELEEAAHNRIMQLEQELQSNKEYLQTTIEELYSSNEELQSTNEELQTSKEELQSMNEELSTVNLELQKKIEELSQVSSDLSNLLSSTEIGTIFLDKELNIQRFTPAATRCINLIPSDVGRPVGHQVTKLTNYGHLVEDSREVLRTLQARQEEVQTVDGAWYLMRIIPHRTLENKIDGVVVLFVDISERKELEEKLEQSNRELERRVELRTAALSKANEELKNEVAQRQKAQQEFTAILEQVEEAQALAQEIVETVSEPLLVLDGNLHVIKANRSFYQTFKVIPEETEQQFIYDLGGGQWNIPGLCKLLEEILPQNSEFNGFKVEHDFPGLGHRSMLLNARRIPRHQKNRQFILLVIEDIT